MRRLPALIASAAVAVVLAASLTGCAEGGNDASCKIGSGPSSDAITATGDFNQAIQATVPSPLNVRHTERSFLIKGTGPKLQADQFAQISISIFDGGTGAPIQHLTTFTADSTGALPVPGLVNAMQCAPTGSRIAVVVPPAQGAASLGAASGDSAVAIVDISKSFPTRATGRPQVGQPGFPTVVLAPNGRPGVILPADTSAPTSAKAALLRKGDGAVLTAKDAVVVQYTIVNWDSKDVASSSWQDGKPALLPLNGTDKVTKALLGERIGSQLLLLLPAKDNNGTAAVYVLDLLGVQKGGAAAAAAAAGAQ